MKNRETEFEPWEHQDLIAPSEGRLTGIAFGKNRFVVVGANGLIFSSENGMDWKRNPNPIHEDLEQVFYYHEYSDTGNAYGCFMAIGKSGAVYSEIEGGIWKQIAPAQQSRFTRILHPDEWLWTIYLDSGSILYATHLLDTAAWRWKRVWTRTRSGLAAGAFGAGQFVSVGQRGAIVAVSDSAIRSDSLYFQPMLSHTLADLHGIAWGRNRFIAVGDSGVILSSVNGEVWKQETSGQSESVRDVAFGLNQFIAITDTRLLIKKSDVASGFDSTLAYGDHMVGVWMAPEDRESDRVPSDNRTFQIGQLDSVRTDTCRLSDSITLPAENWVALFTDLPGWGAGLSDFVPPGWNILVHDSGDFDNDSVRDFAFVLEGPDSGPFVYASEARDAEEKVRSPFALGIIFGDSSERMFRLALQDTTYITAYYFNELFFNVFQDTLSISFATELRAGGFEYSEHQFKYLDHGFRLVFAAEHWRNGQLDFKTDSLDLQTGIRKVETGNESGEAQVIPAIKVDTAYLSEPILLDNFIDKWQGIRGFQPQP